MPRTGTVFAWSGVVILLGLSVPLVSSALEILVSDAVPLDLQKTKSAQCIVVLGGGLRREAAEYGGDTLNWLSLERVRYAALLARETHLPILVSGGKVYEGRAEADVMREVLEREYNLPVQWVESSSRDTHQNAIFSASLLKAAAMSKVVLVTHSVDSRRAEREFRAAGIEVIPAPTVLSRPTLAIETPGDLVPSMHALERSYLALYELLANLAVTLRLNGG
jgi:uncharacterized SAM-binding protein YcdF (DUF218 family)